MARLPSDPVPIGGAALGAGPSGATKDRVGAAVVPPTPPMEGLLAAPPRLPV
jgi:hypothetical protein